MRIQTTIYIDPSTGDCSDNTNMWDWSIDRLNNILDYCWYKEIADLAQEIINNKKKKQNLNNYDITTNSTRNERRA